MSSEASARQIKADEIYTSTEPCDYLGAGSYGKVQRVYTTQYGTSAAKIFHVTGTVDRHGNAINLVKREANILTLASHENIVRFQAICCWSSYVAIIMEYEVFGSLHQALRKREKISTFPFNLRYRMAFEIVKALVFLHNSGLDDRTVHGDLKTTNILLTEDLRIRVADFGAATIGTKTCDQPTQRPSDTLVHSVVFTAPEFLENIYTRRTTAMDIYSFGRVIYQLIVRHIPFESHHYDNLSIAIINGAMPIVSMIPEIRQNLIDVVDVDLTLLDVLIECMNTCCSRDPDRRPKAVDLERAMKPYMENISSVTLCKSMAIVLNQMDRRQPESLISTRIKLNEFRR